MDKKEEQLDLLIIGSGPAGLTAAIYAARAKLNTLVLENELVGGQIRGSYSIENYPGFTSIGGIELSDKMQEHAIALGAKIDEFDLIQSVSLSDTEKIVETGDKIYKPKAVIIATGSKNRPLPIPEEEKFHGNGVHYCELCDGAMYEGKDLVVIGGGNAGVEGALFLAKYAKNITLVHILDHLQADETNQEELKNNEKIKVIWNTEVVRALGEQKLESLELRNVNTKETSQLKTDGIFVYIGRIPATDFFKNHITLNKWGYIETNENMETNIKGVFAAGDVRSKLFRQITTATSDGTIASLMAEKFITQKEV